MKYFFVLMIILCCNACQNKINPQRAATILASQTNVALGMAYLHRQEMPQAKEKFLLALQQTPDSPFALEAMAYFLAKTGDTVSARRNYQHALALAPHQGMILNNYAVFLCQQNQGQLAISLFLKALKDPLFINSAKAYQNAGLCALSMHQSRLASHFFAEAIQQDPNRSTSQQLLVYLVHHN